MSRTTLDEDKFRRQALALGHRITYDGCSCGERYGRDTVLRWHQHAREVVLRHDAELDAEDRKARSHDA
jgi:hypothetical protein